MTIDKNLILHLPFDDPDGYGKAFDYSQSRADGVLSNGAFFTKNAKIGKALDLNGDGECETSRSIPFNSDFTLCFFVKPATKEIGWLLNFSGINNYLENWIDVRPGEWLYLSFVKKSSMFTVFVDGREVYKVSLPGTPIGFSFNDSKVDGGSYACIDEVSLFNVAKTQMEIVKLQSENSDVEYYIDGQNIKEFRVYVSKSSGLLGLLDRKEGLSVDYDSYHGIVVDKKRPRFKERTITLECFLEASGKTSFVEWVQLFMSKFQGAGNQRLRVEYDGKARPLLYEVYCPNAADVEKEWSYNNDLMVGTFKVKLVECEPVKRVLRHIGAGSNTQASITVTSSKLLNIYWGDGTHTYDVSGTDKTVTHTYNQPGEYDIIVAGVIEDIRAFDTNAIVIWDRLQ